VTRLVRAAFVVLGLLLLGAAVVYAIVVDATSPLLPDVVVVTVAVVLGVVSFLGALVQVSPLTSGDDDGDADADGPDDRGPIRTRAPERTPDDEVSGRALAELIEDAGTRARTDRSVASGVAVVRPHLRETLADALVFTGTPRTSVEDDIDAGRWTDDTVAASVLSPQTDRPRRTFTGRLYAWLFPERVVRQRVRRAVQAVAEAADNALPPVPGQRAPRSVPVRQPTLEELRRGVDDRLQSAVDPSSIAREPDERTNAGVAVDRVDDGDRNAGTRQHVTDGEGTR